MLHCSSALPSSPPPAPRGSLDTTCPAERGAVPQERRSQEEQRCAGIPGTAGRKRDARKGFSLLCGGSPGRMSAHRQLPLGAAPAPSPQPPRLSLVHLPAEEPGWSLARGQHNVTQRGGACLIPGNTANFQILPCRVARGISTNRGWGKCGFLGWNPGGEDVTQHEGVAGPSATLSPCCMY